mmetsp:Transcript_46168/g.142332  ORF Transcript_46168/g.142332 Transcript_46168/m.142332 type:complete len:385 (-) Transcript_46168:783-1937(-)
MHKVALHVSDDKLGCVSIPKWSKVLNAALAAGLRHDDVTPFQQFDGVVDERHRNAVDGEDKGMQLGGYVQLDEAAFCLAPVQARPVVPRKREGFADADRGSENRFEMKHDGVHPLRRAAASNDDIGIIRLAQVVCNQPRSLRYDVNVAARFSRPLLQRYGKEQRGGLRAGERFVFEFVKQSSGAETTIFVVLDLRLRSHRGSEPQRHVTVTSCFEAELAHDHDSLTSSKELVRSWLGKQRGRSLGRFLKAFKDGAGVAAARQAQLHQPRVLPHSRFEFVPKVLPHRDVQRREREHVECTPPPACCFRQACVQEVREHEYQPTAGSVHLAHQALNEKQGCFFTQRADLVDHHDEHAIFAKPKHAAHELDGVAEAFHSLLATALAQ